jgi:hypothetical protein
MNAIAHAVETFDPPESSSLSSSYHKDHSNNSTATTGSYSVFKAPSISSLETGLTNMSSGSLGSHNSAYSYGSRHSLGSMNSLKAKERRRRRRLPTRTSKASPDDGQRLFQCTFCTDTFKSKYDWYVEDPFRNAHAFCMCDATLNSIQFSCSEKFLLTSPQVPSREEFTSVP